MVKKQYKVPFSHLQQDASLHGKEYLKSAGSVIKSGWYVLGQVVTQFEGEFAEFLHVKWCIGVANGLEALQISLMALGISKDDEVITTPMSAAASTLAILAVGAKPVFVDIDNSGNIDCSIIKDKITAKTKAILPVHLYGQPADLKTLTKICKDYELFMVEDACQAHGSTYNNQYLGTIGDSGCFSFYPTKNLAALGDGGAIVTGNSKLAQICFQIRDYGQSGKYIHERYGLNSRLDELQAAFLLKKLKFLDKYNSKRRKIAARYISRLGKIKKLKIVTRDLSNSNFHLFVISTNYRDRLQEFLAQKSVQTLIHYPLPIPEQKFIISHSPGSDISKAKTFSKQILSLPCHPFMSLDDVDYVSDQIKEFFAKNH